MSLENLTVLYVEDDIDTQVLLTTPPPKEGGFF
jgi:hypothetical protein